MIQAVKDLQRLREITSVVARHGFGELLDRSRIWEALGRREKAARLDPAAQRASTARRFRDTLAELSTLQDRAAPMPLDLVLSLIDQGLCGLGPNARTQFERIDPEPLASASIAQVHCARLKPAPGQAEGERVVVKVQRPGIEQQIRSDTDLLFYLARFLEGVIEETGIYTPTGIVTEFRNAMLTELDFENEARNIAEFARNHQGRPYVAIPSLHANLSSRTVLTMGELVGVKMSDVLREPGRWDCKLLARQILDASFHQLFTDGLFHGDPHPGNVLVLEGNRLGLLDFGLVGRMHKGMQESIILLVLAISLKDPDTVARLLYKAGIPDQRIDLHRFRADIGDLLDNYLGIKLSEIDSGTLLTDLVDLALKYKIKIPKEYAVLSKAAATTEGLLRVLDPDLDVVEAALPYAKQLLFERYNPTSMSGGLLRLLLQLQGFLQDTPQQLSQILMDLEGGKFSVHVRNEELQKVNGSLKALGIVVFMSTVASALIVGAFTLVGRSPPEQGGGTTWPLPALVGLAVAAMLFGAVLTWTLLSGRLRKLSVRRWMK